MEKDFITLGDLVIIITALNESMKNLIEKEADGFYYRCCRDRLYDEKEIEKQRKKQLENFVIENKEYKKLLDLKEKLENIKVRVNK